MTVIMNSVVDLLRELWDKIEGFVQVFLIFISLFALCAAIIYGGTYLVAPPACEQATADIGYSHRWLFWGGCQIEVEEGLWIPLENYRYIEP